MTSSVDGLVSGLSTSSLITQLMQVEAAPQTRLKTKVSTAQTAVASYQTVNAKLSALKTAGDNLGALSTWRGITAKSSSSSVTATALTGTSGTPGTLKFDVKELAKSQLSTARVSGTDDIVDPGVTEITITTGPFDGSVDGDGNPTDIPHTVTLTDDHTVDGIAAAINKAGIGVRASVVSTSGSDKVLQLTGTKTGADHQFEVAGLSASVDMHKLVTAQDARLEIGGGEANSALGGYDVTSSTNTFTGLMPGVTIAVSKENESDVTVEASSDIDGIAAKFQAMVDAANATLTEIGTQTKYDAATKTGSPLTGDFMVRNMAQTLLSKISQGVVYPNPDYDDQVAEGPGNLKTLNAGSYAKFGIQLTDDGQLKFSASDFKKAYAEDPQAIQDAGIGIGGVFETLAGDLSTNVKSVILGRKSEIDRINSQINNWDVRLAAKRLSLQKTYSDLEVALGNLKNQSNWLAGQLSGLA